MKAEVQLRRPVSSRFVQCSFSSQLPGRFRRALQLAVGLAFSAGSVALLHVAVLAQLGVAAPKPSLRLRAQDMGPGGRAALRALLPDAAHANAQAPLATLSSEAEDEGERQDLSLCTLEELFPSLSAESRAELSNRGIIIPSAIQEAAAASLVAGRSAVLHSETGSGKTLAFLLPALVRLQQARDEAMALVIAPTRELAVQIWAEAERHLSGNTALITLASRASPENIGRAKILVVTPKDFLEFCDEHDAKEIAYLLARVEVCILDEFDELIPKNKWSGKRRFKFQDEERWPAEGLLNGLIRNNDSPSLQVIAVSATAYKASRYKLNKMLFKDTLDRFKNHLPVIEPVVHEDDSEDEPADDEPVLDGSGEDAKKQLHTAAAKYPSLPPGIQHLVWKVPPTGDNARNLAGALGAVRPHSAVVFLCPNAGESVQRVVEELFQAGWTGALALSKQMFPDSRHGGGHNPRRRSSVGGESRGWRSMDRLEQMRDIMRLGYDIDYHEAPIVVTSEESVRGLDLPAVEVLSFRSPACASSTVNTKNHDEKRY